MKPETVKELFGSKYCEMMKDKDRAKQAIRTAVEGGLELSLDKFASIIAEYFRGRSWWGLSMSGD